MTKLVDESALQALITLQKGYIDDEVSDVASDLSTEVSARTAADSALQVNIDAEAAMARAAEQANASGISTLNTNVGSLQTTVTTLQGTVNDLVLTGGTVNSVKLIKVSDLEYTLTVDDTSYSLNIPEDQFLEDVVYDSANTQLVFTFKTTEGESVVNVDVSDLVDIYTNSDGSLTIEDNVIGHANNITAGATSSTATGTLAHGGSFIVPTITFDKFGHITATGSTTQTLPSETVLSKGTEAIATATLEHGGTFEAYTSIAVSDHTITPTKTTFTLPEETELSTGTEATASQTLESGGTFAAYTAVSVSGHTITPTKTTFTLPGAATLAGLGGVGTVTATGDDYLTLSAAKTSTSVAISGSVDISKDYYNKSEVDTLDSAISAAVSTETINRTTADTALSDRLGALEANTIMTEDEVTDLYNSIYS